MCDAARDGISGSVLLFFLLLLLPFVIIILVLSAEGKRCKNSVNLKALKMHKTPQRAKNSPKMEINVD